MKDTLVIPDCHAPYHHQDAIPFLCSVRDAFSLEQVISVGDEADNHAMSFHETNPDLRGAGDELEAVVIFMKTLRKAFPKIRFCDSNHGSMLMRRAIDAGIPKKCLKGLDEIYETPGFTWHDEILEDIMPGIKVCFRHQFGMNVGLALPKQGGVCIVQGHYHSKSEVVWLQTPTCRLFGMSVGCLIDTHSLAFAYNKVIPARPILSCGVIKNGTAFNVQMWTDKKNRWTGNISL